MLKPRSSIKSSRGYKQYTPGLFLIFMLLSMVAMAKTNDILPDSIPPQILTVASITLPKSGLNFYEITFYQSARFYKLMLTNKNCKRALLLLKQSKKTNKPVQVILTEMNGDIIDKVKRQ